MERGKVSSHKLMHLILRCGSYCLYCTFFAVVILFRVDYIKLILLALDRLIASKVPLLPRPKVPRHGSCFPHSRSFIIFIRVLSYSFQLSREKNQLHVTQRKNRPKLKINKSKCHAYEDDGKQQGVKFHKCDIVVLCGLVVLGWSVCFSVKYCCFA